MPTAIGWLWLCKHSTRLFGTAALHHILLEDTGTPRHRSAVTEKGLGRKEGGAGGTALHEDGPQDKVLNPKLRSTGLPLQPLGHLLGTWLLKAEVPGDASVCVADVSALEKVLGLQLEQQTVCATPTAPKTNSPSPFTSQSHIWTCSYGVRAVSSCSELLCGLILGECWGKLCHMYMLGNK